MAQWSGDDILADPALAMLASLTRNVPADEGELSDQAVQQIVEAVSAAYCVRPLCVWLWDPHGQAHRPTGWIGWPDCSRPGSVGHPDWLSLIDRVGHREQPVRVPASELDPDALPERARAERWPALWILPIVDYRRQYQGVALAWETDAGWTAARWAIVVRALSVALDWTRFIRQDAAEHPLVEAMMELTGVASLYIRTDATVGYANRAFGRLFHQSPEDAASLVGSSVASLMVRLSPLLANPDAVGQMLMAEPRNLREELQSVVELKGIVPQYLTMGVRGIVAAGRHLGKLVTWTQISDEGLVRQEKNAFLSLVAHEFRTPITVLQGMADWMTQSNLVEDPFVLENLRAMWREVSRLMRLIREIWSSVYIQDPEWNFDMEWVDLGKWIQTELDITTRTQIDRPWIYEGPGSLIVWTNRELITTVVGVLLSNANRFSSAPAPVEVSLSTSGDRVELVVRDRGQGIDPELRSQIFTKIPESKSRPNTGGIGLGLWLSHQVVSRMGGTLSYAPREGGGSVFTVTLPMAPAQEKPGPSE